MNEDAIETEKHTSLLKGCSSFFLTSSALSCFNGWKNRKNLIKNAVANEKFQKKLQRQKEIYEDNKEAEEWAFRFWLRGEQRKFAQTENIRKLENDLQKADLQMFFKDWPLQISIEALNDKRKKTTSEFIPMSIVVGKHSKGNVKDPLSVLYDSLVDDIKSVLTTLGINESCIYRFKENTNIYGGAALAYIYSMMSTFPVVVILPSIDVRHGKFNISIGIWNQDSLFPLQKRVFSLDFDSYRIFSDKEYLNYKVNEIKMYYIALSAIMNDSYSLIENDRGLAFPAYAIQKNILSTYPRIVDFAIAEYQSLLLTCKCATRDNTSTKDTFSMPYSLYEQRIGKVLLKAIGTLKS